MSAVIFTFPEGVIIGPEDPRYGLEPGRKAIVITQDYDGAFVARVAPATSERERKVEMRFPSAAAAREYGSIMMRAFPKFYQMLVDHTPAERGEF